MALQPAPNPGPTDGVVLLRAWREDDKDQLVAACNDPEIPRWTAAPEPYTEEDALSWIRGEPVAVEPPGTRVSFAVADATDDDLVLGSMSIMRVEQGRMGEIGYWTAAWARGRGFMPRAVRVLAGWGFEQFELRRVELLIAVGNDASNRVAEKAGFTREGVLRQYRENKGVWRDHVMWSLIRGEL